MTRNLRFCLLLSFLSVMLVGFAISAQPQSRGEEFKDPEGKYSLTLPPGWQAIESRDGLGRLQVDIVYRVREDGSLRIRRITVEPGTKAIDVARREEEQSLRFRPGYAKGAIENFGASVNAALVSYDFTNAGRPMVGRNYYLLVNETTVYLLQFAGNRNIMGPIRNQTDAIARSFKATP
jgi:hypothetical protein